MLFDLEDYATTIRVGCMDEEATNYDPTANRKCADCCRYPIIRPYQEATVDGKNPITEDCCLKLNDKNPEGVIIEGVRWTPWRVVKDSKGISRCIRGRWDYFYNRK